MNWHKQTQIISKVDIFKIVSKNYFGISDDWLSLISTIQQSGMGGDQYSTRGEYNKKGVCSGITEGRGEGGGVKTRGGARQESADL